MPTEIEIFDFHRMFIGDVSLWFLLEVAFRTSFMFVYTLILIRATGKRSLGNLSPFELLLVVALGSAVGDPMFYPDVPLFHAMVVVAVIVLLQRLLSLATDHSTRLEHALESTPTPLVVDGVIALDALTSEHLSRDELFMFLREEGVEQLGQVKRAYLEPSGRVSTWLFKRDFVVPGLPLLPAEDPDWEEPIAPTERAAKPPYACASCGAPSASAAGDLLGPCAVCKGEAGWSRASLEAGRD